MILVFFVPMVVVSLALILWQLLSRHSEALDASAGNNLRPRGAAVLGTS
jgi:hypothetical protein